MPYKAEDAGGLTPARSGNAMKRKTDRKDDLIFKSSGYISRLQADIFKEESGTRR